MKSKAQIKLFLREAKRIVRKKGFILVPRRESRLFMTSQNISAGDIAQIILGLTEDDCFDGPEPDRDEKYRMWTVAEFSPSFKSDKLYLKLSVALAIDQCKCLSVKLFTEEE